MYSSSEGLSYSFSEEVVAIFGVITDLTDFDLELTVLNEHEIYPAG